MRIGRLFSSQLKRVLLALAACSVLACGGPAAEVKPATPPVPPVDPGPTLEPALANAYDAACRADKATHAKAVETGDYLPADLAVKSWPAQLGVPPQGTKPPSLGERAFADALKAGGLRHTFIVAAGGTGKTRLVASLRAQLCGEARVFAIDLARAKGKTPLALLESNLGLEGADAIQKFESVLAAKPWILLVDSLDEVPIVARTKAVKDLNTLSDRFGKTLALATFVRPSVLSANYGFDNIDAILQVPFVSCKRVEERVLRLLGGDAAANEKFWALLKNFQLDGRVVDGNSCHYQHLATYRDLQAMVITARALGVETETVKGSRPAVSSRSKLFALYLRGLLGKDLGVLQTTAGVLFGVVGNMVDAQVKAASAPGSIFSVDACTSAQPEASRVEAVRICSRMMVTPLFERVGESQSWRFASAATEDYFLARWLDRALAKEKTTCDAIGKHANLLMSTSVPSLLAGEDNGARCLGPMLQLFCARGRSSELTVEKLQMGLPFGAERAGVIQRARTSASGGEAACVAQILDRVATAAPTPAPPAPNAK